MKAPPAPVLAMIAGRLWSWLGWSVLGSVTGVVFDWLTRPKASP